MFIYLSKQLKILFISAAAIVSVILVTVSSISVYRFVLAASETQDAVALPIVMYHHITKNHLLGDYVITPDELEGDLQYLKERQYHTVVMQDLIDYVYSGIPLPQNPVMITFDDGNLSNYAYALPLLEKYQMKAVVSIVGSYTDQFSEKKDESVNYAYMSWEKVSALQATGRIEIQNHTYNLHSYNRGRKGVCRKAGESMEEYKTFLSADLKKMQDLMKQNLGAPANTFTYPYGFGNQDSEKVIRELGFQASLSCDKGVNYLTREPNCLYRMKRNNRPHNVNREGFFQKLLSQ